MFELTLNMALMLYLSATLAVVLGVWVFSHYRMRNRTFFPIEKTLFICEYCQFAYVEESVRELNRCPQCQLFNKHNKHNVHPSDYR